MRSVIAVGVLLAACGDGVGAPDATTPSDSQMGLVRVRYRGGVQGGHPVYFQNADGSAVMSTRTDGDGTANAFMGPGGYVTVVDVKASTQFVYTWAQVKPGDEIVVEEHIDASTTIWLSIPVEPTSNFYNLDTTCGSNVVGAAAGSSAMITLGDCHGPQAMLVRAFGAGSYIYVDDVPVTEGATVNIPPPYRPADRSTIFVRNVPPGVANAEGQQQLIAKGRSLMGSGFVNLPITGGEGVVNFDMPLPPTATVMTELAPIEGQASSRQHVVHWEPAKLATTIDFSVRMRGYLSRPVYDVPAHAITWTEDSTGSPANVVVAAFGWFRPEIGGNYQWRIVAPRGADPIVKLPVLPDTQYIPRAGDTINDPFTLTNIAIDGGYDRIRALLPSNWSGGAGMSPAMAEGAVGDLVYQELTPKVFDPE